MSSQWIAVRGLLVKARRTVNIVSAHLQELVLDEVWISRAKKKSRNEWNSRWPRSMTSLALRSWSIARWPSSGRVVKLSLLSLEALVIVNRYSLTHEHLRQKHWWVNFHRAISGRWVKVETEFRFHTLCVGSINFSFESGSKRALCDTSLRFPCQTCWWFTKLYSTSPQKFVCPNFHATHQLIDPPNS